MKTIIDVIFVTDQTGMAKQQQKINQWRTTGIFIDMQVVATSEYVVFTITRHKEAPTTAQQLIQELDDSLGIQTDRQDNPIDDPADEDDAPF